MQLTFENRTCRPLSLRCDSLPDEPEENETAETGIGEGSAPAKRQTGRQTGTEKETGSSQSQLGIVIPRTARQVDTGRGEQNEVDVELRLVDKGIKVYKQVERRVNMKRRRK